MIFIKLGWINAPRILYRCGCFSSDRIFRNVQFSPCPRKFRWCEIYSFQYAEKKLASNENNLIHFIKMKNSYWNSICAVLHTSGRRKKKKIRRKRRRKAFKVFFHRLRKSSGIFLYIAFHCLVYFKIIIFSQKASSGWEKWKRSLRCCRLFFS